jgi:hypothetical protein
MKIVSLASSVITAMTLATGAHALDLDPQLRLTNLSRWAPRRSSQWGPTPWAI